MRRDLDPARVTTVDGWPCADGLQTLMDLSAVVDDLIWEQALESALRLRLTTVAAIEGALSAMSAARVNGVSRIKRVLALRPSNTPHTTAF